MRVLCFLLLMFPLLAVAQLSVVPNISAGSLNSTEVLIPGLDLRYQLGDEEGFLRFQSGYRPYFAQGGQVQQQFHFGFAGATQYLEFAYLVGGFSYHLDNIEHGVNDRQYRSQWVWEFEYWGGMEFRFSQFELLPFLSIGVDGNYTAGIRLSTAFKL